jgi:hypothetical protein
MNPNDNLINVVAEALEQIWHEYESKEQFYTYDDEGVSFNYFKCCETRVIGMGGALLHSVENATNTFHRRILISGFEVAMKNIETKIESKNLDVLDYCAFEASMLTFDKLREDLQKLL